MRVSTGRIFVKSPIFILVAAVAMMLSIGGCKKNDSNPVTAGSTTTATTTADVADAVSDALAANNGGAIDQINDVFEIAGGVGVGTASVLGKVAVDSTTTSRSYDTTSGSWTLNVAKVRSTLPLYYGIWTRNYWYQFRANGRPQKYRIVGLSVADTVLHQLLGGTGYYWTPRLVHHLNSIASSWVVSGTNSDTVTINGTYARSGVDTIKSAARNGTVLNHELTLTLVNVRGPRGVRLARSAATSGTIDGTYTATVTVPGQTPVVVTKTFVITLGGGYGNFTIDGTKVVCDLATGDH